jgi:hypothetical protein
MPLAPELCSNNACGMEGQFFIELEHTFVLQ